VRNATAALVTAVEIGVDMDDARRALAKFGGVARRFQYRGSRDDITFIDDYAHLPTEVAAALEAASGGDWGRVVCIFQPHRFTRTAELWESFASAFQGADVLVVTSIYASGESPIPGVNAKLIVDAVTKAHPEQAVAFIPHREELRTYLMAQLRAGDLCLTLGAGDLTTLPDELLGP
jgi:UDP-N-acetylmuramate--alanine ligase